MRIPAKHCTKCGEYKALTEFQKRSSRASGFQSACKSCDGNATRKAERQVLMQSLRTCAECPNTFQGNKDKRYCSRACQQRAWKTPAKDKQYREKALTWYIESKRRPCMDCGGYWPDNPEVMDYDHRPGEVKLGNPGEMRYSKEKCMAEIAKCDLVCANCHRIRTVSRR